MFLVSSCSCLCPVHWMMLNPKWKVWDEIRKIYLVSVKSKTETLAGNGYYPTSLQWRHYNRNVVSNHLRFDCLFSRLLRCRSKKISKLRVTGLCVGNSPVIGEFPAQKASNAENASIGWRHHDWWKQWHEHGNTRYHNSQIIYELRKNS